jgi:hypothetical protein
MFSASKFNKIILSIFLIGVLVLVGYFSREFFIKKPSQIKEEKTPTPFVERKEEEKLELIEIQNPQEKLIENMSRLPFEYYSLYGERNKVFNLTNPDKDCPRFTEGLILIPFAAFPAETVHFVLWIEDCQPSKIAQIKGEISSSTIKEEIKIERTFPKGKSYQWEGRWDVPFNVLPGEYLLKIEIQTTEGKTKELSTPIKILSLPIATPAQR